MAMRSYGDASSSLPATPSFPPRVSQSVADDELLTAAVSGNLFGIRRALSAGATLDARNAEGFTAICIAAERGHAPVLELLCDSGLDPAQKGSGGWTPLMWAARNGHLECVTALCRRALPTGAAGCVDLDATLPPQLVSS